MFTAPLSTLRAGLTNLAIRLCPTLILDRPEKHFAERARNLYPTLLKESGYLHLQATKPHTIGEFYYIQATKPNNVGEFYYIQATKPHNLGELRNATPLY